jgi:hypothetical protein
VTPIPCRYNGIKFRSKLEAHWYAYFRWLGFTAIYEPEAFEFSSGCMTDEAHARCQKALEPLSQRIDALRQQAPQAEELQALQDEAWKLGDRFGDDPANFYHATYLPDFHLQEADNYVEIKPLRNPGQYDERDRDSICLAYLLGYETPTIVVLGSPFRYYAIRCNERHKGNPSGDVVAFERNANVLTLGQWGVSCYPDENWMSDFQDPRENACDPYQGEQTRHEEVVSHLWNQLQWKPAIAR